MSSANFSRVSIWGGHITAGLVLGTAFGAAYFVAEPLLRFWGNLITLGAPLIQILGVYVTFGLAFGGLCGLVLGAVGALARSWATPERYVPFYAALMIFSLAALMITNHYDRSTLHLLSKSRDMLFIVVIFLVLAAAAFLFSKLLVRRKAFRRFGAGAASVLAIGAIVVVAGLNVVSGVQAGRLPKRKAAGEIGPNVVFILLDALRYDHLSLYGYHRETSPNIDRLAGESVVFTNAHAQGNRTIISTPSIFTSLYPSFHGAIGSRMKGRALPESRVTLAETLRDAGYTTVEVTSNAYIRSVFGMTQGFDKTEEFRAYPHSLFLYRVLARAGLIDTPRFLIRGTPKADDLTDSALRYLRLAKDRPLFLYVHYMDTHHPFDPPPPYNTFFGDGSTDPDPITLFNLTRDYMYLPNGPDEILPEQLQKLVDYYDGSIRFADEQIGRLLDEVRALSEIRETMVIITADHGDEFLDHGAFYHTNLLFEELIHVPLIIWNPKRYPGGLWVESLVRHIDLFPRSPRPPASRLPKRSWAGRCSLSSTARPRTSI